ncbi:toll/interleukin-1 receptor domain-containing protein [Enterococcus faecalis]|nr:toll/interleukin-1 receptor domain-containing protein [Enterococcus faecalis]
MKKPTIFFSHSSKDRDLILPIKNKLSEITSNVINIFMSSDGQSIPFGNNWIHKIEEGLRDSKIMFVFITQNSINNAWVYFESGFAYSKGIEVIPVGIGINVGDLKPPLNLLQGFNVTSGDSLNNFVDIVNQKFDLNFKETFSDIDYDYIKALNLRTEYDISQIFESANYSTYSQYSSKDDGLIRYDLNTAFETYKKYLNEQKIKFSIGTDSFSSEILLVNGIHIKKSGKEEEPKSYNGTLQPNQNHKLEYKIATKNFPISFELLKNMIQYNKELPDFTYLNFLPKKNYMLKHDNAEISSILGEKPQIFSPVENSIGGFLYKESLFFIIFDYYKHDSRKESQFIINIGFSKSSNPVKEIMELISELVDLNIITQI